MNLKAKTSPKRNIVFCCRKYWTRFSLEIVEIILILLLALLLLRPHFRRATILESQQVLSGKTHFSVFTKSVLAKWDVRWWYLWCGSWHVNDGAGPGSSVSVLMMVTRFIFSSGSWLMNIATRNIVTQSRVKLSSERWWC